MMLDIVWEDEAILVVRKPSGIESQSGKSLSMDMVSLIKNELMFRQRKAGKNLQEPYVGIIHRLDRPVNGVMVYAKTPFAAAQLSRQVQNHQMKKKYYALLCQTPAQKEGKLTDYLIQDKKNNMSRVATKEEEGRKDAKKAVLQYRIIENTSFSAFDFINEAERESLCLVDITLITGRHHQIRVQFSHIGCPIWGDTKYNPDWNGKKNIGKIGLCAYELTFFHPITKQQMTVRY